MGSDGDPEAAGPKIEGSEGGAEKGRGENADDSLVEVCRAEDEGSEEEGGEGAGSDGDEQKREQETEVELLAEAGIEGEQGGPGGFCAVAGEQGFDVAELDGFDAAAEQRSEKNAENEAAQHSDEDAEERAEGEGASGMPLQVERERAEFRRENDERREAAKDGEGEEGDAGEEEKAFEDPGAVAFLAVGRGGEELEGAVVGEIVADEPGERCERKSEEDGGQEHSGPCLWIRASLPELGVFAEDDAAVPAPVFVEGDELPGDGGGEMAEEGLVGGMDVEGGGDEEKEGVLGGECAAWGLEGGEVAAAGELAGAMEGADAGPVIERLEREVKIVVGLELEDGETSGAGDSEEVEEGAGGGGGGEELRVDGGGGGCGGGARGGCGAEFMAEGGEVAAEDGFEPAFGLEAEERIGGGSGGMAAMEEAIGEVKEEVLGGVVEEGFAGAGAEEDLVLMLKGAGDEGVTDAGVFETVEGEGDFGGAAGADFGGVAEAGREKRAEVSDGDGGALERGLGIEGMGKLDVEVAVGGGGAGSELAGGGAELEELPLSESGVEPGHAGAGDGGAAGGDDDAESVKKAVAGGVLAAEVEPEDAKGEGSVDGGGRFFGTDTDDGPGGFHPATRSPRVLGARGPALGEDAAGVGGAKAVLEVHGGPEGGGGPAGEVCGEGLLEGAEVVAAGGVAGGGGAEVGTGNEGERLRLGLAEAAGFETEGVAAGLKRGDGADEVALGGPEMEKAAAVVGGDGAVGEAEIEEDAAVFEDGGVGVVGEERLEGAGEGSGGERGGGERRDGHPDFRVRGRLWLGKGNGYQRIRFRNSVMWATWWRECQA